MALTKEKKQSIIDEVSSLLNISKMTVIANYKGTPVKAMQALRSEAKQSGTTVKVVKNRLVKQALQSNQTFEKIDLTNFNGMLLYAFNSDDEVAAAQTLAKFAKTQPTMEFVGALSADGTFVSSDEVKVLASLPSKDILRSQLVGTLTAPLTGFLHVVEGNLRGFVQVLSERSKSLT